MKIILVGVAVVLLTSCTSSEVTVTHSAYDPYTMSYWTDVRGPMDLAGADRAAALCQSHSDGRTLLRDRDGEVARCWTSYSPGTLQGFMAGGFGGAMEGAGLGMGLGMMKPARTEMSNVMSGGSSTVAPGAAVASSSPVVSARARGGAGGAGGQGGVGMGGSATSVGGSATSISSPTVTATGGMGGSASAAAKAKLNTMAHCPNGSGPPCS